MKSRNTLVAVFVIAVFVCAVGVLGYLALSTFDNVGEQAVAQMNPEEQKGFQRAARIHKAMEAADVYAILGEPTSEVFGLAKWDGFGGSRLSQLRVYFFEGHPRRIRWF